MMLSITLLVILIVLVNGFTTSKTIKQSSSLKASSETEEKKQRWEVGRFLRTASFYNAIKIPFLSDMIAPPRTDTKVVNAGDVIWSKEDPKIAFGPLDDVVMGGVSKSNLEVGAKFDGLWTGFVTSANNGGFAGIRSKIFDPKLDASSCRGLVLKLTGDGNRYKFIGRDDVEWNGIAWSTSFDTIANKFIEVKIPFTKLKPTRFARTVTGIPPFNSKFFTGMQLSLSKFEYDGDLNPKFTEGSFKLDLESVKLF